MDEELPYADDVPYEEQLPSPMETVGTSTLKARIGNRIYLLEDSVSRKRKLVDTENSGLNEEVLGENGDSDIAYAGLPHRPNALLIQGAPISHLPTARVFAYATHFDAHPVGLEWIDDQSCVLVFSNRKTASEAWGALRKTSQVTNQVDSSTISVDDGLHLAPLLPVSLYPMEERINSVLGNTKPDSLKEPIHIRWALSTDVKKPGARVESAFYKRHGEMAGKESFARFQAQNRNKRHKYNENDREARRRLDEELDIFLEGNQGHSQDHTNAEEGHSVPFGRRHRQLEDKEEERRRLDSELDAFLAYGDNPEHLADSLEVDSTSQDSPRDRATHPKRDRQYRALPRRGRRRESEGDRSHRATVGDGRWLHNAEIAEINRRRKDTYNGDGFGMRAWADDGSPRQSRGVQSRKPQKTQEELDRELDDFAREGI